MKIFVRAFGPLQSAMGKDQIELELPENALVKDALERVVNGWIIPKRPELWDLDKKQFSLPVVIMISQKDIQDENQALDNMQEIFLVAPMAGGGVYEEFSTLTMGAKA
jgi:molybdopterin converting factor small subunit